MGEGHIPVTAIAEMIRVVKPGGTVVIVMREEYLTYVKEYVNKLEPYMKDLEDKGFWKQVRPARL
jgi:ubiquinone/menaquinone biosynthesis C-methylase UbiE